MNVNSFADAYRRVANYDRKTLQEKVKKAVPKTALLAEAVKRRLRIRKPFIVTVEFLVENGDQRKIINKQRVELSLNTPERNVLAHNLNKELLTDDDFARLSHILNRSADFRQKVDNLISKLVSIRVVSVSENAARPHDIAAVEFRLDETNEFLFNRHIEYAFDADAKTWLPTWRSDYIIDNYVANACFPTILIDTYRDSLQKYSRGKKVIDYEYFARLKGLDSIPADGLPFTLPEISKLFLTPHRIQLIVLDVHNNVQWTNVADVPNKNNNIGSNPLYVFAHNAHIYRCTKPTKDMCQLYKAVVDPGNTLAVKEPSPVYKIGEPKRAAGYIRECKEVTDLIATFKHIREGPPKAVQLATPNVEKILLELIRTHKYEPSVKVAPVGKAIQSISLKVNTKQHSTIISIAQNVFDHVPTPEFGDDAHYNRFSHYRVQLFNSLISTITKSYYSTSVSTVLFQKQTVTHGSVETEYSNFSRTPVHGRFPSYSPYTHEPAYDVFSTADLGFDFVRQYTSCLMMFDDLPVLSVFDEFEPYADTPVDPRYFYIISVYDAMGIELILASRRHEMVSGYTLLELARANIRFTITHVLKPHKFVKNRTKEIIQEIYEDAGLTSADKKNIVNIVVGQTLKLMNRNVKANLYADKDEAGNYHANYFQVTDESPDKFDLFVGYDEKSRDLIDGFYFIGLLVYEFSRITLYRLAEAAEEYGTVVGCKVDCVFVQLNPQSAPFTADSVGKFRVAAASTFGDIGCIKLEKKADVARTFIKFRDNVAPDLPRVCYDQEVVELPPDDEFNAGAVNATLTSDVPTVVLADCPGAGKTSALAAFAISTYPDSHLFVAPFNRLRQDLKRTKGVRAITVDKLVGRTVGKDDLGAEYNIKDVQFVVFDEIYLNNVKNMSLIMRFMRSHPNIKYAASGDIFQNEPFEDGKIDHEYYVAIVKRMFPRVLMLHVNKRLQNPADRDALMAMLTDLKSESVPVLTALRKHFKFTDSLAGLPKDADHIVYRNDTAEFVNAYFGRDKCFAVGEYVLCRTHLVKKKYRFYVNIEYKIKEKTGSGYVLKDDEKHLITVTDDEMRKYFKLPYAATGHSLQGLTRGEKVVIYDIVIKGDSGYKLDWLAARRWLVAAVTRCTTLDVTFYSGNEIPRRPCMSRDIVKDTDLIKRKLRGYAYQDRQAKRDHRGNITVDETVELLTYIDVCHHCQLPLTTGFTLDRIDDNLPHTRDNVVLSCLSCNHRHLNRQLAE
eukprot:TRINITY_DN2017_c0_g1_i4.p1 TRINITY_DN2017_c0_g1~~TRINITY_DN2017_c0_g1_i4.p1  ORF type:complete len:1238 (+),score=238.90 TRINITY_DN2017_c0_g1_i4:85-3798(+)